MILLLLYAHLVLKKMLNINAIIATNFFALNVKVFIYLIIYHLQYYSSLKGIKESWGIAWCSSAGCHAG